jgi:PAS domain-containing protein
MKKTRKNRAARVGDAALRQDASRRREDFTDLLFQAVNHSSELITMADLEGVIIFVNRAFLRTFGYFEHEIIGQVRWQTHVPQHSGELSAGNDPEGPRR